MQTCRHCRQWREPYEPRGPGLEQFARGCWPVRMNMARADWPWHPDEDRAACPSFQWRHAPAADAGDGLTDAEMNRRAADPQWRDRSPAVAVERAAADRRNVPDRRMGIDRRGLEPRQDRERRTGADRRKGQG